MCDRLIYVGPAMAAVLSALGAALVGVAVASRTLYALARDRILASALATVSHQTGTPARAVTASMTLTFALQRAFGLAGTPALDAFFYLATTGALSLLVVYVLVSVSALRLHMRSAVINGDFRPRYCPSAERSRLSTCSIAI